MPRLIALDALGDAFVEGLQRAWSAGDAVLPLDPRLPPPARQAVLTAARPHDPVREGDALVLATSGTSGRPKLVVLTHAAVAASARATSARLGVDPSTDRWLACLPLAHVGGLSVVSRALVTGTACTVHERFEAAAVEAAARAGCTRTSLVPAALSRIDAGLFRTILVGGQAPPAERPAHVVATYGMTETGSGIVYDGHPLDGVELRIDDDGQILVRGPMLLRAYRDGADPKDADGWYPTGDLGRLEGARLAVHGRADDLIVSGGQNVWPAVVEDALRTHPAVQEVAVIGEPDPAWGQRVVAVVVPVDWTAPPSLQALRDHAASTVPAYAAPKEVRLRRAIPRTSTGKVQRSTLTTR
jgi:O-succinylbenzoic acid--CoA ligase